MTLVWRWGLGQASTRVGRAASQSTHHSEKDAADATSQGALQADEWLWEGDRPDAMHDGRVCPALLPGASQPEPP